MQDVLSVRKLELRGQGEGKIYICTGSNCNFKRKSIPTFERDLIKKEKLIKRDSKNNEKDAKGS